MPPTKTALEYAKLSYFFFAFILITNLWKRSIRQL